MSILREGALSITELTLKTKRDRATVSKDVKLPAYYGLVTVSEETNPGHGHHNVVHAISKYLIHLKLRSKNKNQSYPRNSFAAACLLAPRLHLAQG